MKKLADGRIRRTESEWRALIKKFEAGSASEAAFCRARKLSRKSFREWRARLADAGPSRTRATRRRKTPPAGFVELTAPPMDAKPKVGPEFELELPGGVRLRWRA
jgi:hypothetical protein